eukprot:2583310-Alexandrium_andersonii.AAC.1
MPLGPLSLQTSLVRHIGPAHSVPSRRFRVVPRRWRIASAAPQPCRMPEPRAAMRFRLAVL